MLLVFSACGSSAIDEAGGILRDDGRFGTATEAGVSFGRIGDILLEASEDCPDDANCEALRSATAYALVLARSVLTCTAPGRHDARRKMEAFLEAVQDTSPDEPVPDSPRLPDCR